MRSSVLSYLSLGSNLGAREDNLLDALSRIKALSGLELIEFSSLFESKPQDVETQNSFVNAVCKIETSHNPDELLHFLQSIESEMGRVRNAESIDRIIDIDIVLFGREEISTSELIVPHPRMRNRPFVLIPLAEIEPYLRIPPDDVCVKDLLMAAHGSFWVRRISSRRIL